MDQHDHVSESDTTVKVVHSIKLAIWFCLPPLNLCLIYIRVSSCEYHIISSCQPLKCLLESLIWWQRHHQSTDPDNKVHGANMEPTWVLPAPDGPHEPCYLGSYWPPVLKIHLYILQHKWLATGKCFHVMTSSWFCTSLIDGLVQDCSNSSVLAMELLQSCTKPLNSSILIPSSLRMVQGKICTTCCWV